MKTLHDHNVLVLGLEGSGKTTLVKHMKWISRGNRDYRTFETGPTIGMERDEVLWDNRKFVMREIGGRMLPIWHKYYAAASMVLFVVDGSTPTALGAASIALAELCESVDLQGKPVLVVVNKRDVPSYQTADEVGGLLLLEDFNAERQKELHISCIETSASRGQGLGAVFEWLVSQAIGASPSS